MTLTTTFCIFVSNQLYQDEIIEILDQTKAPELNEAMVNANMIILKCLLAENQAHQQYRSGYTASRQ
jgi:hypothetical protein